MELMRGIVVDFYNQINLLVRLLVSSVGGWYGTLTERNSTAL
jgi:hypothetical protein